MGILAQDTFVRANASGSWGTASDSNVWARLAGNSNLGILNNQGTITGSNQNNIMALGTGTAGDQEVVCNITVGGAVDTGGVALRINGSGNTFYVARIGTFGNLLDITKYINGSATGLDLQSFTYTTGVAYTIKSQVIGTTIKSKIWIAGQSEPGGWLSTITDTSIASGRYGLLGSPFTSGVAFDHFVADDTQASNVADKLYVTRLSQYAIGRRLFATRLKQFVIGQRLYATRFRQGPPMASHSYATRFSQYTPPAPTTNAIFFMRSGKAIFQLREP